MSTPIKDQLVALFNSMLAMTGVETTYTVEDLTFAAPVAYDPGTIDLDEPESANTYVPVTYGADLTQVNYNLHYCRLDFAHLISLQDDFFQGSTIAAGTTAHDLLTEMSAAFGVDITVDDIEDLPITNITADDAKLVIKAKADSLAFRGQVTVTVLAP